jgi:hypothetical protein
MRFIIDSGVCNRRAVAYHPDAVLAYYIFTGHWSSMEDELAWKIEQKFRHEPFKNLRQAINDELNPFAETLRNEASGYIFISAIQCTTTSEEVSVQQLGSEFAIVSGVHIALPAIDAQVLPIDHRDWWSISPALGARIDYKFPQELGAFTATTLPAGRGYRVVSELIWKAMMKSPLEFVDESSFEEIAHTARKIKGSSIGGYAIADVPTSRA